MKRRSLTANPVVLLVEDEPLVRMMNLDILSEAGFRVLDANDADEAFEILKRRPEVRAVLTDVDMPGSLNGFEFARLVHQGWPEVGIVVTSGKMHPNPGDLPRTATFIPKPFRPDTLVKQLEGVMRPEA